MTRLLIGALALAACGEPLWDHTYQGEARVERFCELSEADAGPIDTTDLEARFYWIVVRDGETRHVFDDEARVTGPLDKFRLRLYEEPAAEHRLTLANGTEVALGQVGLYRDGVLVAVDGCVVVFASAPVHGPPFGELAPGFQVMRAAHCSEPPIDEPRFRTRVDDDFCYLDAVAGRFGPFRLECPLTARR